jgi:hypothetical protein
MAEVFAVRFSWQTPTSLPRPGAFFEVTMGADAEHPHGRRGLWMARCWDYALGMGASGLLCLDGDTAVDLVDVAAMGVAIEDDPDAVHVAPVRLYPPGEGWVWAHGRDRYTQVLVAEGINLFGFAFTYLPGGLLDACVEAGLAGWEFPLVNKRVSAVAEKLGCRVRLVGGVFPVHLNWG